MSEPNALPRWEPQVHIDPILLDDCSECEAQIRELTAELKELREFVGAMDHIEIGKWDGLRTDEHTFAFMTNDKYHTGTDPFDAWRKMNAGEVKAELEGE